MTSPIMPGIRRRTLLLGAAAGLAAPAIWRPSGARAQSSRIVVRDDGGIYTQAYTKVFYRPFTEATGIQVVPAQAQAEPTAQIRSMVETRTYTWDMGKISVPAVLQLTSGEVDLISTWVSRAQSAQAAGAPVEIVWNQNIWGCDGWSILAGTPNADACRELIKFASDPARMAQLVEFFPAGIVQPAAFEQIPQDMARSCPTYPENIAFPLKMRRTPAADARRLVQEALDMVRLPHIANRYPRELSGGQQQRVALARCTIYRPSVILMDEPLGALDKKLRDQMQFEILRIHKEIGGTIVYVTHDQEEAMTMSDRICLMNGGRIAQLGSSADLYFRPQSLFVADFLGEANLLADPALTWQDLRALRDGWKGRIVLKGVLAAEDALRARAEGVDGIVVSTHGGRNFDCLPTTAEALPRIAGQRGVLPELIADSGVRRGSDVLKYVALGALAVQLGRAPLWGLAARGETGAAALLEILLAEMRTSMGFLGARTLADLARFDG